MAWILDTFLKFSLSSSVISTSTGCEFPKLSLIVFWTAVYKDKVNTRCHLSNIDANLPLSLVQQHFWNRSNPFLELTLTHNKLFTTMHSSINWWNEKLSWYLRGNRYCPVDMISLWQKETKLSRHDRQTATVMWLECGGAGSCQMVFVNVNFRRIDKPWR